jgi:hypothetical protein
MTTTFGFGDNTFAVPKQKSTHKKDISESARDHPKCSTRTPRAS